MSRTFGLVTAVVLAACTPALAGRIPTSSLTRERVNAGAIDSYKIVFQAGEVAEVEVRGDGDTDLDLFVHDENGNAIVKDDDGSDHCYVRFVPRWTGKFTVRVVNRGTVYNNYIIRTN
jgi:hypothetical protein